MMKKVVSGILSAVMITAGMAFAGAAPAVAQQATGETLPLKIGLIDFGRVVRESDAGRDLNQKFEARLSEIRAEVTAGEIRRSRPAADMEPSS